MVHRVRLFAQLKERAGSEFVEVEFAEEATVGDVLGELRQREDSLAAALAGTSLVMAVDRVYADAETPLRAGDELALIPPVSGGAEARRRCWVGEGQLSLAALSESVASPAAGAVVTFQGITREVERLDYEAYFPMAEERIEAILDDALKRHEIEAAAAAHRVGAVALGEASVIVAVSAGHRGPAFAAAREVIDRIKAEVPIWKREVEGDRAAWVEGTPPPQG